MSSVNRTVRLLMLTAMACVAMATVASAAQAEATWVVKGQVLPEGKEYPLTCTQALQEQPMQLTAAPLGVDVKITAEVECEAWKIVNLNHHAYSTGRFTFNNVVVDKPLNCEVMEFASRSLTGEAIEVPSLPTGLAVHYAPVAGTTVAEFEFLGEECAFGELVVPLSGTFAAEVEPLNVFKEIQPYRFNSTAQTDTGSALKLGNSAALLTGVVEFHF